jgi:hypothetical protein
LLKNNGKKDYNFAKFCKNKNELPDEKTETRVTGEVSVEKARPLHVHEGAEALCLVKRVVLSSFVGEVKPLDPSTRAMASGHRPSLGIGS